MPWYSICILTGVAVANLAALREIRHFNRQISAVPLDVNDLILAEGIALLGGILSSKIFYLILSAKEIDWSRMTDLSYFNEYMRGGFVFYGGLIGALLALWLAAKLWPRLLSPASLRLLLRSVTFAIPLAHGFGRIGCFLSGCCYGVSYDGPGSVTYLSSFSAPNGVPLFPVQLLEACTLFALSTVLFLIHRHAKSPDSFTCYLLFYGSIRFLLEFLRGDAVRGHLGLLSTSQWISLLLIGGTLIQFCRSCFSPHL